MLYLHARVSNVNHNLKTIMNEDMATLMSQTHLHEWPTIHRRISRLSSIQIKKNGNGNQRIK